MTTAVERYEPGSVEISDREWVALERRANALAKSSLVPQNLRGKPADVFAILLAARDLDLPATIMTVRQFHVIDGGVTLSAQLMLGQIASRGHTAWVEHTDDRSATVAGQRAGSEQVQRVTVTIDQARQAGMLDEWVEHKYRNPGDQYDRTEKFVLGREGVDEPEWVVKEKRAGRVKRRENWHRYPADMLVAWGARRVCKRIAPEAVLGLASFDDTGSPVGPPLGVDTDTGEVAPAGQGTLEEGIVDAEIVEEESPAEPEGVPPPEAEPPDDPELVDDGWAQRLAMACTGIGLNREQKIALVRHAIGRDIESTKQVHRGDEVNAVNRWFIAVRDGRYRVADAGDGKLAVVEVQYGPDQEPF